MTLRGLLRPTVVPSELDRLLPPYSTVGICGQAPSDYPEFVDHLVAIGIDSISVNPDCLVDVRRRVATAEARLAVPAENKTPGTR